MTAKHRPAVGIRRHAKGWQAYIRIRGRLKTRCFPIEATVKTMKDWRESQRVADKYGLHASGGDLRTFRQDAEDYLDLVKAMPTFADRKYRIEQWIDVFGSRVRATLTAKDIRAQLEAWRKNGRAGGGALAPASLNQRRTALMSLFTALDGRGRPNPVKDVPPYPERSSEQLRARDPRLLYRLLVRVGRKRWKSRRATHRGRPQRRSKTRARLRLMLWTGWPQSTISRLKPEHIDRAGERVYVPGRLKGRGTRARWLPLLPGAVRALEEFERAQAWGPFSTSAMHSSLARAVADENAWRARFRRSPIAPVRPYDFRHTFGTEVAKVITDERAIQELMLHATARQTRRYTDAATEARLEAARRQIVATLATSQTASDVLERRRQLRAVK